MKKLVITAIVASFTSLGTFAQTSTTSPAPAPAPADANAPLPGANSFTEGQAKSRLEANGYTAIGEFKKDDIGVWKGTATHGGQPVAVSVDYRGNITRH